MDEEQTGNSDCEANANADDDSVPEMDVEESSDEEMDEDLPTPSANHTSSPCSSEKHTETKQTEKHTETKQTESASLPKWQPRTQMYNDNNSHVVVAAFVPGMSMDKFNIMVDGTELLIKGKSNPRSRILSLTVVATHQILET